MAEALQFLESAHSLASSGGAPQTATALRGIARAVSGGQTDAGTLASQGEALLNGLLSDLGSTVRVSVHPLGQYASGNPAGSIPARPRNWYDD